MLAPGLIYPGSEIDLTASFTDQNGNAVDPDTVKLRLMSPERTETLFTYGSSTELTRPDAGHYVCVVKPNKAGRWWYRWETTGTNTVLANEGDFLVQRSPFFDDPGAYRDYC